MTGRDGAALLALACVMGSLLGSCGGAVDSDSAAGGVGSGTSSGGSGLAGTGGGGVGATGGAGGAAGEAGSPPRIDAGPVDCSGLNDAECALWSDQCVPLLRNDIVASEAPPLPPGVDADPCCIGCEGPTCVGCHSSPRFIGCRDKSACGLTPEQLCGYLPAGACP